MYLAIDVGGSKVLVTVFDSNGTILRSTKIKTPPMYPDFIAATKAAAVEVLEGAEPHACAIAMPGAINRGEGVVRYFGNLPWENVKITADLSDTITCPIYLENDAKMAALAEAHSLKDLYSRVLYVTVSTGIGFGLVVDGVIDQSTQDAGGRGIVLEHQGRIMAWEEFASGRALHAKTGKLASDLDDDSPEWYGIARNVAVGLNNLTVALSPECVVIGGGVGSHLEKFHEHLHEELELYRNRMIPNLPQIAKAQHPEEAVVYGGYLLCKHHDPA